MTSTKQLDVSDYIQERSDFVSSTHSHPPTPEKKRTKKTNQINNQQHLLSMAISNMILIKALILQITTSRTAWSQIIYLTIVTRNENSRSRCSERTITTRYKQICLTQNSNARKKWNIIFVSTVKKTPLSLRTLFSFEDITFTVSFHSFSPILSTVKLRFTNICSRAGPS